MSNSKSKVTPMTMDAAARIRANEAVKNGGKIPAGGFGARADATAQRHVANAVKQSQPTKNAKKAG